MIEEKKVIFIHGLEGSSQGYKAKLLRDTFPRILIPDFRGPLAGRLAHLEKIILPDRRWLLIGSSFGGLMAALYASRHPGRVRKLILLAPALIWPQFGALSEPIPTPTRIYHGNRDEVIPVEAIRRLAEAKFSHVDLRVVDDDHMLHQTVRQLDWSHLFREDAGTC
jgi:pimeloyl-ACP methyl ester carboxylesterase